MKKRPGSCLLFILSVCAGVVCAGAGEPRVGVPLADEHAVEGQQRPAPGDLQERIAEVVGVEGDRLGEAGLRGWWQSHGLDQAGQYVLGGSFPRTWRCAALELAITSAKRRQEEMLGRPTALHRLEALRLRLPA